MKIVKAFAVLVAIVAFGVYVYFDVYKSEKAQKEQDAHERRLIRFDLDRIKSFTLAHPDSSIVFERSIGRIWNITKPIKTEADGKPLYMLFNSLDQSDILITVEDTPKDLAPYGLAHSNYFMAMQYENDDTDTLFIGDDSPDGMMSYMKFASEKRVLAVSKQLTEIMKRSVNEFRSKTILNVLADDITSVEILRTIDGKDNRVLMTHTGFDWMMEYPWKLPGDQSSMEELTKKLAESYKRTLEEELSSDLSKYGLDKPSYIVTVKLKYNMPEKMLLIGKQLTGKGESNRLYAKQFDNDLIFTLDKSVVTLFDRVNAWFIDKQPIKFNRNVVDKIVIQAAKNEITLMKDAEGKWSAVSPVDKNLTEETINSIFAISRFLLINDIVSIEPTQEMLEETGITKPTVVLSFYENNNEMVKVVYGKTFLTENENTYMTTSLSPILYVTNSTINASINEVLNSIFGN